VSVGRYYNNILWLSAPSRQKLAELRPPLFSPLLLSAGAFKMHDLTAHPAVAAVATPMRAMLSHRMLLGTGDKGGASKRRLRHFGPDSNARVIGVKQSLMLLPRLRDRLGQSAR